MGFEEELNNFWFKPKNKSEREKKRVLPFKRFKFMTKFPIAYCCFQVNKIIQVRHIFVLVWIRFCYTFFNHFSFFHPLYLHIFQSFMKNINLSSERCKTAALG